MSKQYADSDPGYNRHRDDLWERVRRHEAAAPPIPDDLTEDEMAAIMFAVMQSVPVGDEVSEDVLQAVLNEARQAKFKWWVFRGAMAGALNLNWDGGLTIGLSERFRAENSHLAREFERANP